MDRVPLVESIGTRLYMVRLSKLQASRFLKHYPLCNGKLILARYSRWRFWGITTSLFHCLRTDLFVSLPNMLVFYEVNLSKQTHFLKSRLSSFAPSQP